MSFGLNRSCGQLLLLIFGAKILVDKLDSSDRKSAEHHYNEKARKIAEKIGYDLITFLNPAKKIAFFLRELGNFG